MTAKVELRLCFVCRGLLLRCGGLTLLAVLLGCFAVTSVVRAAIGDSTAEPDAAGTAPSLTGAPTPAHADIGSTEH